jgi:hypothetical protein
VKKINMKTRKILTYKTLHPRIDTDKPCVKRKGGGRGLLQTEATYKAKIINISENKISRRPVCEYCYKPQNQSTKYELNN